MRLTPEDKEELRSKILTLARELGCGIDDQGNKIVLYLPDFKPEEVKKDDK